MSGFLKILLSPRFLGGLASVGLIVFLAVKLKEMFDSGSWNRAADKSLPPKQALPAGWDNSRVQSFAASIRAQLDQNDLNPFSWGETFGLAEKILSYPDSVVVELYREYLNRYKLSLWQDFKTETYFIGEVYDRMRAMFERLQLP